MNNVSSDWTVTGQNIETTSRRFAISHRHQTRLEHKTKQTSIAIMVLKTLNVAHQFNSNFCIGENYKLEHQMILHSDVIYRQCNRTGQNYCKHVPNEEKYCNYLAMHTCYSLFPTEICSTSSNVHSSVRNRPKSRIKLLPMGEMW